MDEERFEKERKRMVAEQLRPRGIRSPRVLSAFEFIPRHLFVPEEEREWAYGDHPLSIGFNQTISQPYIVALMTERLGLTGSEKVLEVGTGSGYQAAILSRLAREVHTIEIIPELAIAARVTFKALGISNIQTHTGDGSLGLEEYAPYEAITVTAAAPHVPRHLLDQLADGGRMTIPVGSKGFQELELWKRSGATYESETIIPVTFVPLRGAQGWGTGWNG
jgi:protein-L-isoaspartate(D-aspartate) O-methyltransferase